MKKLFALTLVTLLMLSLFGCAEDTLSPAVQLNQSLEHQTEIATQAQTDAPTVAESIAEATKPVNAVDDKIGEKKAKEIALSHAGLKESDVSRIFVELDYDDGILRYEVDFRQGQYEYDYDIDAKTGKILSYDKDIDD